MTARTAYETDAYRTRIEARVLETGSDEGGPWVLLSDTVLYPEGGGQPRDHGQVAGTPVRDLVRTADGVRHYLDLPPGAPVPEADVTVTLEWGRRFDHMVQHTAQHLLTALAHRLLDRPTTSFHLGPDRCDIELEGPPPTPAEMDELEEAAAAAVRANRPIDAQWISREAYDARTDIRTRGLPDHHTGEVRLIEIEGIDLTACGGTHVARTGELEAVKLLSSEAMRGGARLHWIAGARVRRRLAGHEDRASALRGLLGVANDELVGAVELKLEQLKDAQRRVRHLEDDLSEALVARLLQGEDLVVSSHFTEKDAGFLRALAARFSGSGGERTGFFTAVNGTETLFVVVTGPDAPAGADVLGPVVADALEGRGGGRGPVFQGKAPGTEKIEVAEALLRRTLES